MTVNQAHILAENWTMFVFLFSLSLLAFIRYKRPVKLQRFIDALQNTRLVKQIIREESLIGNRFSFFMAMNFGLMLGLSIYFMIKLFYPAFYDQYDFHLYWIICLFILIIYLIKTTTLSLIGNLFVNDYGFNEYLRNVFLFNGFLGWVLLLLNIVWAYSPISWGRWVAYLVLGSLFVSFSIRLYRGLLIGKENHASTQYLFLYLCTLEILPTAVLIKQAVTIII